MSSARGAYRSSASGGYYRRKRSATVRSSAGQGQYYPPTQTKVLRAAYGRKGYGGRKFYYPTKAKLAKYRRGKSTKMQAIGRTMEASLDSCAREWIYSIANPYSGPEACNAFAPPLFTQRMRNKAEASILQSDIVPSGSGAVGVIMARFAVSSDFPSIIASGNTAWTTASTFSSAAGTNVFTNYNDYYNNSIYAAGDFAGGKNQWCPVSLGLRFQFLCPAVNFGGSVTLYETIGHIEAFNNATITLGSIQANVRSRRVQIKPGWNSIVWSGPQNQIETQYNSDAGAGGCCLIMVIDFPTNASSFDMPLIVQTYTNWEFVGPAASGCKYSTQDPTQGGRVMNRVIGTGGGQPIANDVSEQIIRGLQQMNRIAQQAEQLYGYATRAYNTIQPADQNYNPG